MILPVRLYIDPILSRPTLSVSYFTGLDSVAKSFIETMEAFKGVGLAAPQVGLGLNMAALSLNNKTDKIVVANIINICYDKERGMQTELEGCLSCPGVSIKMKRYLEVEFDYQTIYGEKKHLKLEGFNARIFQHEADHLVGKMIINNLGKF